MPALSILIKPASGNCNIKCDYCFYRALTGESEQFPKKMSKELITTILQKSIDFAEGYLSIAFQGGEPTLCGLDFFKDVVAYVNDNNAKKVKINYAIQTNGILLDEKWASFLYENNFLVGISLDGIMPSHDKYRIDNFGKPTFARVVEKIKLLKKYNVNFNILTVLNSQTVKYPKEIYNYYKIMEFEYIQFLECLDPLNEKIGQHDYSLENKAYAKFLIEFFDLWYQDLKNGKLININIFDNYLAILAKGHPFDCGMWGFCSAQFIFETDGSVYPCDFYVLDKYKIGNIKTDDFYSMKKTSIARRFEESSLEVSEKCLNCKYIKLCRGGCRRAKENDKEPGINRFCDAYKEFFDQRLEKLLEIVKTYNLNK